MERKVIPNQDTEPNHPACTGVSPNSWVMEGNMIPKDRDHKATPKVPAQNIPIITHR